MYYIHNKIYTYTYECSYLESYTLLDNSYGWTYNKTTIINLINILFFSNQILTDREKPSKDGYFLSDIIYTRLCKKV